MKELIAEGVLNSDGTLPDSAVNYNTSTSAKSLSKTTATQVTQGEALNPVTLNLGFTTDIWRVYVNDTLADSAYSPSVSGSEVSASANGVTNTASSSTSATISFSTSAMTTGSNTIAAAFVPDVSSPNQEIAKTTLGIITVSSQSGTTSDDTKPDTTSNDKTPDTTSNDKSNDNSNNNSNDNSNETTNTNGLDFNSDSYTTGTANSVSYRADTNITYVANPVNES